MAFDRQRLPDPITYFEASGMKLKGGRSSKWMTTSCLFHHGSDSMRVNVKTGAFKCMNCGVGGGDILSFHMQLHDLEFVAAATALGAWVDDGLPTAPLPPTALSPRAALEVLGFESTLAAVAAGNVAKGVELTDLDRKRLFKCAARINRIAKDFEA